jgi:Acylphosphatase
MDTEPVDAAPAAIERHRITVEGAVQGVGYRPFVHRLATGCGLGGLVLTALGGSRVVDMLAGDPLPRICGGELDSPNETI